MIEPQADQNLADAVADRLRDAILAGVYAPGDRLVERRLALELGTSHIPLREALARLSEEGLVERLPRRGARVASLSPRLLEEVSSLRVLLEQFVVRRVNGRFTAQAHARLQESVDEMLSAAENHDLVGLHALDQRFHEQLWELADHTLLLELVAQLRGRLNHFFRAAALALEPDDVRRHAESHQALLDVIVSGDRAAAERAMRRHVETATSRIAHATLDDGPQGGIRGAAGTRDGKALRR